MPIRRLATHEAEEDVATAVPSQSTAEGHFYVVVGRDLDADTGRYKVLSLLGEGFFSKVVECWDRKLRQRCAAKIVRIMPKYPRDPRGEIAVMERVRAADPRDAYPLMKIQGHFVNAEGHTCIVMPACGPSLHAHVQRHGPLPHRHVAEIVFQCGVALDFLHKELRLIHTDVKPENILLESAAVAAEAAAGDRATPDLPCRIRICDLGTCRDERHPPGAIVSTRPYRAPEVMLGLGWMYAADAWSMGCVVYEIATGRRLFDTRDTHAHLHLVEKTLGDPLPRHWASSCSEKTRPLFDADTGKLRPLIDSSIARAVRARPIVEVIDDDADLRDLILGLLHVDPAQRLDPRRMAAHPYVDRHYPESLRHPVSEVRPEAVATS
eukprot:CAMPEP_0174831738 /NCGR_PEP_ID=MMETSP1114-20130205/3270_1 /TAXON_ID=312471 /ORGANISM="Neobodo designis, Strain CCAP 1951/1" /LENGTH=379 /DNA_ID=CAMNT_0016065577 /DNA_START=46 /DNA_END=1185 /DNA_ORIENTATION=-